MMNGMEGIAELGFAGLAAVLLFTVFKWMTGELTKKIDRLEGIITVSYTHLTLPTTPYV